MNPWTVYDELIAGVDPYLYVDSVLKGLHWCTVRSGSHIGMAMMLPGRGPRLSVWEDYRGCSLREVAALIKSWNYPEASIGMAALNCFYNSPEKIDALGGFDGIDLNALTSEKRVEKEAFFSNRDSLQGLDVCVVGHFPSLERQLNGRCNLSILERSPLKGDLPDPACEYVLPSQDYVFITGTALTNKTLPRLLQLCRKDAQVFLVGPSVCLSPLWFQYNVKHLSGFSVLDGILLEKIIQGEENQRIFQAGVMVDVERRSHGTNEVFS